MSKFHLYLTVALFLITANSAFAQSKFDLKGSPVKNDLLVELLNNSEMRELKAGRAIESSLFLRLYSVGGELDDCAPELETEVTCSFRYYLAVSDGSLGVPGAVYFLGDVGEIRDVKWLPSEPSKPARLRVEIGNYPKDVFPYNSKLKLKVRFFEIEVDIDKIAIKAMK